MTKTLKIRATMIILINIFLGAAILWFHSIPSILLPFSIVAVGLLLIALKTIGGSKNWIRAALVSFFVTGLIPMMGIWLSKMEQSSFESFAVFGLVGVIFGWKECLFMFVLNTALLHWYTSDEKRSPS